MHVPLPFHQAIATAREQFWTEIVAVMDWAHSVGRSVDADALALIMINRADQPDRPWTREYVYGLLRRDTWNWATCRACRWPEETPEALWIYLHHLDVHGGLTDADESLHDLLKPMLCFYGLGFDGRPRADASARIVDCECFEPSGPYDRSGRPLQRVRRTRCEHDAEPA